MTEFYCICFRRKVENKIGESRHVDITHYHWCCFTIVKIYLEHYKQKFWDKNQAWNNMGSSGGGVGDEPQYVVAKYDYIAQGNQVIDLSKLMSHSITKIFTSLHFSTYLQYNSNL